MTNDTPHYAGFWIRVLASLIDTLLLVITTGPLLYLAYGPMYLESEQMFLGTLDVVMNYLFPPIVIIAFWIYKSATPGKMLLKLRIVDQQTGGHPTTGKFVVRYLGYIVGSIPLCLGFIWVAFDPRKQGWHDKMAGTVVLRTPREGDR